MQEFWTARKRSSDEKYIGKPFNSSSSDSEYNRDRARIIHSSSFRRLQSKTQVLSLGESDFYRTRLTHSLEVAQIGSSICEELKDLYKETPEYLQAIPSFSLIEAICLAHDLGHPPFGHGGEIALNSTMKNAGGFEGNGQTLRIVSRLGEYSPHHGIDLTRRTLLGLLKYPALHKDVAKYTSPLIPNSSNKEHTKPPKCIHDEEEDILDWILSPFEKSDQKLFKQIISREGKHSSTKYKAFDTSIMEMADDIAYGVHDLEDAIALELVTHRQWETAVVAKISALDGYKNEAGELKKLIDFCNKNLFTNSNKERKHCISKLVRYFVQNIRIQEIASFQALELRINAVMELSAQLSLQILKEFVRDFVIFRPQVQALEFKGQQMICKLFDVLDENPKRLLPRSDYDLYEQSPNKHRVICDYIAGMTDVHAARLYTRIFTPNIGSMFDR
ncbi:anti-phage deoxyguanosine triphosphatase [Herminiimonas aquatilis]|uniref:Deoxyguanosinetriphosphate triphosphohydrolase-like protein n=1 Tax=Herminiimonas aquatilis TaxID=345342 RepID=A0ABW2J783_9BURK